MMAEEEDPAKLRCPLCPDSGPPTATSQSLPTDGPSSTSKTDRDEPNKENTETSVAKSQPISSEAPDLYWIGCSKCKEWYHSVCLLISSDEAAKATVPREIVDEIERENEDGSVWTDWTGWVDRWYCPKCVAWATDPKNEKPPHHPLVSTLNKKTFPPKKEIPKRADKRSSERTSSPESSAKKPRLGSVQSDSKDGHAAEMVNGDAKANGSGKRPKRQAALNRPDYHALHHHIATPTTKWLDLIANPEHYGVKIVEGTFPRVPATMLSKTWIESSSSEPTSSSTSASSSHISPSLFFGEKREPLLIRPEDGGFEGLGGKIPGKNFTVADVGRLVGPDRMVDVIDVATQQSSQWPLSKWVDYVGSRSSMSDPGPSTKTYNIISLEISGTELAKKVRPPRLVSEIDWVDNFWNFGPAGKNAAKEAAEQQRQIKEEMNGETNGLPALTEVKSESKGKAPAAWPKVQLYCLMGARGSWTDWHVDFAASSVYYTVHTGAKTFFFIRPTASNLAAYAEWSGSYELQQSTWLGSMCDEVRKVTLQQGDTMIIPSGYIHAVYTPADAIVFGGNFLHSYNIEAQLRLRQIEIDTKVPQRFRFPFFDKLCWYVADRYCAELRQLRAFRPRSNAAAHAPPSRRVLEGILALAQFLVQQITIMEDDETEDKRRKLIYDRIPSEIVRDPSGLARELLWRVEREVPHLLAEQGHATIPGTSKRNGPKKGKGLIMLPSKPKSRVWNFTPSPWEQHDHPIAESSIQRQLPRPGTPVPSVPSSEHGEQAEESTHTYRQSRTRTRDLDDGSTVLEEQEVIFTEKRVIWLPSQPAGQQLLRDALASNGASAGEVSGVEVPSTALNDAETAAT